MSETHGTCAVSVVPAAEGRAFRVHKGGHIRIETPHGAQAADFFAFNADNVGEWFSANHTWVTTFNVKPREGDVLLSRFRRPMLEFSADGAGGVHDMMIAACDQFRYEFFGHKGPHPSCSENLHLAMRRLGHTVDVVPQPINFFTNTRVEAGRLVGFSAEPRPGKVFRSTRGVDGVDLRRVVVSFRPARRRVANQCDGWPNRTRSICWRVLISTSSVGVFA